MQQNLVFMRKRLIIRTMMPQDAKTYYSQSELGDLENASKRIKALEIVLKRMDAKNPNMIFAVEDSNHKYIANIKCLAIGTNGTKVHIEILNEENRKKYGIDIVEEFINICKEEKLFKRLYLNYCDAAVEDYINATNSGIRIDVA